MNNKPAWLIDSSIYVFKAWYTRENITDKDGNPINAVLGFLDFVYQLLSVEKPELIAFAFDESLQSSHRSEIYPEYKANRAAAPESLRLQFRLCRDFIKSLGIHQSASQLYEADDLIGTWAAILRQQVINVNIISADKDLAQLIHEGDHWWEYQRGNKLDSKKITKRFGAKPQQIPDQLAIAGDKSDNIPGVPGIGMSTAGKLLRRFDSLDNLFMNLDEISSMQIRGAKRIQQLVTDYQQTIKLSRKLTGIVCDIEEIPLNTFSVAEMDKSTFGVLADQLNLSIESQQKWLSLQRALQDQCSLNNSNL